MARTAAAFGLSEGDVEKFLRYQDNFKVLSEFLGGTTPTGRIFVYFQRREVKNHAGEWVLNATEPELFFTAGDADQLRGNAVFFVRNGRVNLEEECDNSVLCGELTESPLRDLESSLSLVYTPNFSARSDWGKAESKHLGEFLGGLRKFVADMQENLKSLVGGLQLVKPETKIETVDVRPNSKLVAQFEQLLVQWCDQIETYLGDGPHGSQDDTGPMAELEWWRRRMQRLTSITEQLKTKECKVVIGVLSGWTKSHQDANKQRLFVLLRRWKQIDIGITEAANEAKDNVKCVWIARCLSSYRLPV